MSNFSEEEKKAIKTVKQYKKCFVFETVHEETGERLNDYSNAIDIVLNLINKQQKEIEMLKKQQQDVKNRIEYYLVGNVSLDNFEIRNKELRKIEKMLEE